MTPLAALQALEDYPELDVDPLDGWETRSAPIPSYVPDGFTPIGILNHWDAIKAWPSSLGVYAGNNRFGQPLYNAVTAPAGIVHPIAAGYVYNAGGGDMDVLDAMRHDRAPIPDPAVAKSGNGNPWFFGVCAGGYWPDAHPLPGPQYLAMVKINAVLCDAYGWDPETRVNDHRGWTTRKSDISGRYYPAPMGWTLAQFRNDIRSEMEYRKVRNVPARSWAKEVVDWAIATGRLDLTDTHVDDWNEPVTTGRYLTMEWRRVRLTSDPGANA